MAADVLKMHSVLHRRWRTVLDVIDIGEHFFQSKRFSQNIDGPRLAGLFEEGHFAKTGHHDNLGSRTEISNFGEALYTILTGEFDINEGDVIAEVAKFLNRLLTCPCYIDVAVTQTKGNHKTLSEIRIVLHDQHFRDIFIHQKSRLKNK